MRQELDKHLFGFLIFVCYDFVDVVQAQEKAVISACIVIWFLELLFLLTIEKATKILHHQELRALFYHVSLLSLSVDVD